MTNLDIISFWLAVTFYVISSCLFALAFSFEKEKWQKIGVWAAGLGLIPHSAAIIARWISVGHGPYIYAYEVASSDTWFAVVFFLVLQYKQPKLRNLGLFIMPASFLLIGYGVMKIREIEPYPESFTTYWLIVHVFFAKIAYGSALTAAALAGTYLIRETGWFRANRLLSRMPDSKSLDRLSYQFITLAFIAIAIMIVAGSIWAYKAWGRYWGWDPLETWSLVSWLVYGVYLHRRITGRWEGKKAAWLAVGALLVLVFALFGIPYVYSSLHNAYLK